MAPTGGKGRGRKGHEGWVTSVVLGHLGGREVIVSGGWDNTIRIWGFQSDEPWASILLDALVNSVAFNGTYIVGGTSAGIAVLAVTGKPN